MKINHILMISTLLILILAACEMPALDPETSTPEIIEAATMMQPAETETPASDTTSATQTTTVNKPDETSILFSMASGELAFGTSFTIPRGVGIYGLSSREMTIAAPVESEQDFYHGTPFSWSPDGTRIVYVSTREGSSHLYVMDGNNTNVIRITSVGKNGSPAWSPDGNWIAYVSERGGEANIYLTDPEGSESTCLTCDMPGNKVSPAWSPTSSSLAFTMDGIPAPVYILDIQTHEVRPVSSPELRATMPSFSPDDEWIIFGCEDSICINTIYGGTMRAISTANGINTHPSISPNGEQIAFISNRDGNFDLYIMNVEDWSVQRLTTSPYPEMHPAWNLDGQWIAFASATVFQEGYTDYDIFIIQPDGKNLTRLIQLEGNEFYPVWSPWINE